jgi:predicted amidohydrolase YtcJ
MHQEQLTGQIQVGKKADLVVLSENLFGLPPEKIGEVEVVATYFDGREVYTHER